MKQRRNRTESNYRRAKVNSWCRLLEKDFDWDYGEFYQFNLSSCIRQQNSLTAQFVSFSLANLANIFYPPDFYNN